MANTDSKGMKRRRGLLQAQRDLREISAGITALPSPLDLMHVTTVGSGQDILRAGQIEKSRCPVFDQDLVYTFLARPAYRVPNHDQKSDDLNRFPFVFVIAPERLGKPYHVYPLDTGAGAAGKYGDAAGDSVHLEDYELDADLAAAQRHIAWCFENNQAYFDGAIKDDLRDELPHHQAVARTFLQIAGLASVRSNQPDKRASAIEVAYARSIPLRGNIRLVIVPSHFIEDKGQQNTRFVNALNSLGIPWGIYIWQPHERPDHFMDEINALIRRHLEDSGQL